MKITVSIESHDLKENWRELREAVAEFDSEFEIPGAEADRSLAIAGRAKEIGLSVEQMIFALASSLEDDDGGKAIPEE